jgi:crotonobetainyl-CoA:carnitine CoA-transferase CaiB-like acyl-CoA transferase
MPLVLEGVIILDFGRYQAAPYGSLLLADLGAEVIKVEDPRHGDQGRSAFRHLGFSQGGMDPYFVGLNRNKKSVALNVRQAKGRELFYQLARKADVVLDNFRPGVMEAWGLDYRTLKEINSRIVCCHVTGFGYTGPYRNNTCFDPVAQAMGGGMSLTGFGDDPPMLMGLTIGDAAAGLFAAIAIPAALSGREKTGQGREIDSAMADAQVSILGWYANIFWALGKCPPKRGFSDMNYPGQLPVQTRDGSWIYLVAVQQNHFQGLCAALDRPELAEAPRFKTLSLRQQNVTELQSILAEEFKKRDLQEWIRRLWEQGVPSGPVNTIEQVVEDPHFQARDMIIEVEHPKLGKMKAIGNPIKSMGEQGHSQVFTPPPLLGEHTEEVLGKFTSLSKEEMEQLRREGIIG